MTFGWVIYVPFAAGAGGAADDVTIYNANAPGGFRILRTDFIIATAVALATVQLRSAAAGGGAALSATYTAAVATEAPALTVSRAATTTVATAGSVFLRRSDSGLAGEVMIWCARV